MGCFASLGHLKALQDKKRIKGLQEISGASSGSLTGLLYILYKGDLKRMLDRAMTIDIESATKLHLHSFLQHYGFICTSHLKNIMRTMCQETIELSDPTFQELYDFSNV